MRFWNRTSIVSTNGDRIYTTERRNPQRPIRQGSPRRGLISLCSAARRAGRTILTSDTRQPQPIPIRNTKTPQNKVVLDT